MEKVPLVTVLMPVYNSDKYLKEAIHSILNQSFKDFEFLIIDDGSTDNSLNIIKPYHDDRIKLVEHKENKGLTASLNEGLLLAKGKYIARMDADDISYPDRLEKQISYLDKNKGVVILGSSANIIDENGKKIGYRLAPQEDNQIKTILFVGSAFTHPSIIFRKSIILSIGGYNINAKYIEDYDLWIRAQELGEFANIKEPLISYRSTPTGITATKKEKQLANFNRLSYTLWLKNKNPMPSGKWQELWPKKYESRDERVYYTILHMSFATQYLRVKNTPMFFRHSLASFLMNPSYVLGRILFAFKRKFL